MKFLLLFVLALSPKFLFALTATVERIDIDKKYVALKDTATVKYVDHCARDKFRPYEWKMWEGYFSARAFIEPIAVITVRRESKEFFGGNLEPYILRAQAETANIGGNMMCFVKIKKNLQIQEPDAMVFRAYKQLFQSGNVAWENFFKDIMNEGILLTLDDIQRGEKTKDIMEKQPKPSVPK